ncbi:MAG TPA: TonB-dependent receptor [Bryobacteraceae bacterium]|nr:TonB-dependent receptor [Bryobacteraceae bacterium]
MYLRSCSFFSRFALACALAVCLLFTGAAFAQSTATIQGTVVDATGASVPNATVTVRNQNTGEERATSTDAAGNYLVPSLPVGTYRVEIKAPGMQTVVASNLPLEVGSTVRQDFNLKVAATSETIEIKGTAPVINEDPVSVGTVIDQRTVQEIPLNGRHFVDLALLIPGTVTPPSNGFLTAPLRGQGSFAFNSAGGREDSVNYMINGVNLSDPVQNQITFQPTINTVQEFKTDNQTFSAEYGRNSGSIVNIATRSGSNQWHGDFYDYLRNSYFDARNFANTTKLANGNVNPQAPFKRNQFGADGGGYIKKDTTFFFLSYEGLRQRQAVPLTATVLTDAQRATVQTSSDAIIKKLLPLIPAANQPNGGYVSAATANVNIDQGTANISHNFGQNNRLNGYFAMQQDLRGEPPSTDGNSFPGTGDTRQGRRQLLTLNDTQVFSPNLVNEVRFGYNRIHITFVANDTSNAADFGINSGINAPIGLPQISVTSSFSFGGVGNFPQGRGDYSAVVSDTLSWTHGKHSFKFGGETRRIDNNNFTFTPGTFNFPSITAFIADQANSFSTNNSNRSNRIFVNSIGAFALDEWKVTPGFTLELGLRYDWYGTPTEGGNRFVVFDPATVSLVHSSQPYKQSAHNFQPRVGLSWDPFKNGKTVIRSAYAIMTDQPITGIITGLATNPPFSFPVNSTAAGLTLANAFTLAGGSVSPNTINPNYRDSYVQSFNFNIQQELPGDIGLMVGYFGSKGTNLNIIRNLDQPINGVRPYTALSANSPIFPGKPIGSTIIVQDSGGNSNYNGLWVEAKKRLAKGLQFSTYYTWSKSIDYNSRNNQGLTVQDSYNVRNDRGLSDFDARHRGVISGVYELPFKGNRLVEGWEIATIVQLQTGNPMNFRTTNTTLTGQATQRPNVNGPIPTGFFPAPSGSAAQVGYILNPGNYLLNPGNAFGNLGRNVVIGPGFSNVDFTLVKNIRLTNGDRPVNLQIRADAFDILNHANFTQPALNGGYPLAANTTVGVITGGTRFPAGDSGSSRQLQLALKLQF